ncbi:G-protein coupled receptor moody-like [Watersipora subatra]|uniref:G-protein coupled receptor moody-like n=1 Tax=Watersipora subatra TaxID=2589382 RepID=UPI00355BB051
MDSLTDNSTASADDLPQGLETGLAIFLTFALALGVLGNLLTIIVISREKKLRTHSNVYVVNLAVVDILLLSVNLPTAIMEYFKGGNDIVSRDYCKYTSPINIMTMICALNSVAAVGFNRFLLLCKSKSLYQSFTRRSSIVLSLAFIWLWSFCIVLPPMFGYGEFGYHTKFRTCFFKANDEESWMYGTIFCCVLGVFPPVIASSFFYIKILLKLAENKKNLMRHYNLSSLAKVPTTPKNYQQIEVKRVEESSISEDNGSLKTKSSPPPQTNSPKKKKTKQKSETLLLRQNSHQRRSAMMLITVFIVIVFCWLPISISFMLDKRNRLPSIVYVMFVILAWMNSCVNIFIYSGMNKQFRRGYKALLIMSFRRVKDTVTGTSGTDTAAAMSSGNYSKDSRT